MASPIFIVSTPLFRGNEDGTKRGYHSILAGLSRGFCVCLRINKWIQVTSGSRHLLARRIRGRPFFSLLGLTQQRFKYQESTSGVQAESAYSRRIPKQGFVSRVHVLSWNQIWGGGPQIGLVRSWREGGGSGHSIIWRARAVANDWASTLLLRTYVAARVSRGEGLQASAHHDCFSAAVVAG